MTAPEAYPKLGKQKGTGLPCLSWALDIQGHSTMKISDISISRAIAHDVVRAPQLEEAPPQLSDELVVLDSEGEALVAKRLVDTVASGSHCVDVTVDDSSPGSPFDLATSMLDDEDDDFVEKSQGLATSLSQSQTAGTIKSGSAIFVQGTCLADDAECRFLAIMKADSDQGLYKRTRAGRITLTYVNEMLLGESQRLIKIAIFVEETPKGEDDDGTRSTSEFSVKVFDHLMSAGGGGEAAAYFFRAFLRCKIAHNAARQTKQFFELTRKFIDNLELDAIDKASFKGDLISHLRGNRGVIEPRSFARDVLPEEYQEAFVRECRQAGITKAFSKDTTLVKGKLKKQSLRFSSNVTLLAPSEIFREAIKIGKVTSDGWTEVKIKGSVEEAS